MKLITRIAFATLLSSSFSLTAQAADMQAAPAPAQDPIVQHLKLTNDQVAKIKSLHQQLESNVQQISQQEIFGPAMCVVETDTLDQAIAFINANPNGNGTSIFTSSGWAGRKFQNEIDVGQVGINVAIPVPVAYFSFTGSRASKLGDLGPNGKQALYFWTQTKTVTARWFAPDDGGSGVNTTISMK